MRPCCIVTPEMEAYVKTYTTALSKSLSFIAEQNTNHPKHVMLSGPVQGQLLRFISFMVNPQYVLEIGCFVGYSALCLAEGLQTDGVLHTIEKNEVYANQARSNIAQAQTNKTIVVHHGLAADIIPQLNYTWDLVFIDANKDGYLNYYQLVLPKLSKNGIIIVDNVLFKGLVGNPTNQNTVANQLDQFNKAVHADDSTEQLILTVRDGLMIIKKK